MLDLTRGWIVECGGCTDSDFTKEEEREEAHHLFRMQGWTRGDATYCPKCSAPAVREAIRLAREKGKL